MPLLQKTIDTPSYAAKISWRHQAYMKNSQLRINNLDRNEGLHLFDIKQLIHINNELSDNLKVNKPSLPEIKNANGGIKKNYYDYVILPLFLVKSYSDFFKLPEEEVEKIFMINI